MERQVIENSLKVFRERAKLQFESFGITTTYKHITIENKFNAFGDIDRTVNYGEELPIVCKPNWDKAFTYIDKNNMQEDYYDVDLPVTVPYDVTIQTGDLIKLPTLTTDGIDDKHIVWWEVKKKELRREQVYYSQTCLCRIWKESYTE